MNILAIESSCDETSAAVLTDRNSAPFLLSNIVASQIDIHKKYGGVVPEVAARAHIENIIPVIRESLRGAKLNISDLDYIAVTAGPGLIGSLVVGVETAKSIALAIGKPIIPLNHLEGHIYANFVGQVPNFPVVGLLVSGGHTMLIYMPDHLKYEIIGSTRDDAAGEAFDKVAKILGLGYPGGPAVSMAAKSGDKNKYRFPVVDLTEKPNRGVDGFLNRPEPSMDFSFSGLKTAVLTEVKKKNEKLTREEVGDLAASFEKTVIDTLIQNSLRAIKKYQPKTFILSGGVAANSLLRESLRAVIKMQYPKTQYLVPAMELCTDNAGMMAAAAYYHAKTAKYAKIDLADSISNIRLSADPNMKL